MIPAQQSGIHPLFFSYVRVCGSYYLQKNIIFNFFPQAEPVEACSYYLHKNIIFQQHERVYLIKLNFIILAHKGNQITSQLGWREVADKLAVEGKRYLTCFLAYDDDDCIGFLCYTKRSPVP